MLRRRVAEAEATNEDLVAYARGHAGVVAAVHEAVLAALRAETRAALGRVLTGRWPQLLGVDEVAFAWSLHGEAYGADRDGLQTLEPRLVARMAEILPPVTMRPVERGHPLFGPASGDVRSEALIRLDGEFGIGLIVLGQHAAPAVDGGHGARLLGFLGRTVSHMLERWPPR